MRTVLRRTLAMVMAILALAAAILSCGGSGQLGIDTTVQPDNMRIVGLPQYICPTSTPVPTYTQPTTGYPASGYATNTPYPGLTPGCGTIWNVSLNMWVWTCGIWVTYTPYPGGIYTTPAYNVPGATSTPRPTHTPWPSPTPYTSTYTYFFDDDVYPW